MRLVSTRPRWSGVIELTQLDQRVPSTQQSAGDRGVEQRVIGAVAQARANANQMTLPTVRSDQSHSRSVVTIAQSSSRFAFRLEVDDRGLRRRWRRELYANVLATSIRSRMVLVA